MGENYPKNSPPLPFCLTRAMI